MITKPFFSFFASRNSPKPPRLSALLKMMSLRQYLYSKAYMGSNSPTSLSKCKTEASVLSKQHLFWIPNSCMSRPFKCFKKKKKKLKLKIYQNRRVNYVCHEQFLEENLWNSHFLSHPASGLLEGGTTNHCSSPHDIPDDTFWSRNPEKHVSTLLWLSEFPFKKTSSPRVVDQLVQGA